LVSERKREQPQSRTFLHSFPIEIRNQLLGNVPISRQTDKSCMSRRPTQPQASQATASGAEKPANVTTVQFVLGSWPPAPRPKGPSKLNHKKSRKGCRRCKTRRVKVTSPISFIFILIGFRGSLSSNFSFSQFWEIINSGIVSSVPHLCFHKQILSMLASSVNRRLHDK
jgi:hypothetical protein